MSGNSLEEAFTSALLKDSADRLKEVVNNRINEIEKDLSLNIDKLQTKLENKLSEFKDFTDTQPLVVNFGTIEKPKNKISHNAFNTILKLLKSTKRIDKNIMLVGEAGSGKSSLCKDVAEALNLPFYPMSVGLQTTKSDLLGFINAHGEYITTPIRQAFENGGVLLLDEFDATHSGVVTILNSLLANGVCSFPDKIINKHKDFICIVACNTYGKGGSVDYIGRNRLDGATLDRFICVNVGYDDNLEQNLTNNNAWLKIIRKMRANVQKHGLKVIISPRASMQGADLLEAGFDLNDVLEMVIYKGASQDVIKKLTQDVNFGELVKDNNKKQDKPKKKDTNPSKPIYLLLDVDRGQYTLNNIEENTSIVSDIDWEGDFNIYLSSQSDWSEGLNSQSLYCNFGKNRLLSYNSKDVNNLINILDMHKDTIQIDGQKIDLQIQLNGETLKYMLG